MALKRPNLPVIEGQSQEARSLDMARVMALRVLAQRKQNAIYNLKAAPTRDDLAEAFSEELDAE